jgi:hypothetical protein
MSKKDLFNIFERDIKFGGNSQNLIKTLQRNKRDFFVRDTAFMTSLIYDGKEVVFTKKNSAFPANQLWIFQAVNKDALALAKRIEQGEVDFIMPERLPVNRTNFNYDDSVGEITGTDINSAYWTIANRLGVISDALYQKIQGDDTKVVKLAALAILGRDMAFNSFKEGEIIKDKSVVLGNKMLKEFYKAIRYTCYLHMNNIANLLGDEFDAYRTDCIYYRDTEENKQKVYAYLDEHGFYYKQLIFEENEQHEQ